MVRPDDFLHSSDTLLSQADMPVDPDAKAAAYRVEAQIKAIQAVASAIDRLAVSVENLPRV
jgi:hypothetical protein